MSKIVKREKTKVEDIDWKDDNNAFLVLPMALDCKLTPLIKEVTKEYVGVKERIRALRDRGFLKVGNIYVIKGFGLKKTTKLFLLMITHKDSKKKATPTNITNCIERFNLGYREKVVTSVTFPIGSFKSFGGDVKKTSKLINETLDDRILINVRFIK